MTHRSWQEIKAGVDQHVRAQGEARASEWAERHTQHLYEARLIRNLTREQLATTTEGGESGVEEMERAAEALIATMSRFVEARGGRLALVVEWADDFVAELPIREPETKSA